MTNRQWLLKSIKTLRALRNKENASDIDLALESLQDHVHKIDRMAVARRAFVLLEKIERDPEYAKQHKEINYLMRLAEGKIWGRSS